MGPWAARLLELLREDAAKPLRERRNGQRLYDTLAQEGFSGSYPTLQRAIRGWRVEHERAIGRVFIPLAFAAGEAYQFDWSYETVELGGQVQPVKVACSASIRNGTWRQLELPVHPTAFGCASALAFAPRFCFEAASAR